MLQILSMIHLHSKSELKEQKLIALYFFLSFFLSFFFHKEKVSFQDQLNNSLFLASHLRLVLGQLPLSSSVS